MGKKLGDAADPLLVSVRSGSKFSMPGMMDTILNLGLNDRSVEGLKAKTGNPRFAKDSYRRFIQMYGNVVLGIDKDKFEHELAAVKKKHKVKTDVELDEKALDEVIARYKAVVQRETKAPFPQEPRAQLVGARDAVFQSWMNPRAITYRKLNDIPHDLGTAVNVQAMVFGNMGDELGDGRRLHAQPLDRRQGVLRRVPAERAGRRRGGGHPHAAPDHRAREGDAEGVPAAARDHDPARAPLQGRAGLRVHDPGEHALHAPDPQRQAHGSRGREHRGGHVRRGADQPGRRRC